MTTTSIRGICRCCCCSASSSSSSSSYFPYSSRIKNGSAFSPRHASRRRHASAATKNKTVTKANLVEVWETTSMPLEEEKAEKFFREFWQRKPLLMRNAIPNFICPLDTDELAGLACEDEFNSRLMRVVKQQLSLIHI